VDQHPCWVASWEDQAGEAVEADPLMARREHWGLWLPAGVGVLTVGVDLQGDRIELQVVGWGRDEEARVVDYKVIWGDPPRTRKTLCHPKGGTGDRGCGPISILRCR